MGNFAYRQMLKVLIHNGLTPTGEAVVVQVASIVFYVEKSMS